MLYDFKLFNLSFTIVYHLKNIIVNILTIIYLKIFTDYSIDIEKRL